MDLNKLHYFYVVAKHGHVTRGAQELYISQPALSKSLKQLEQTLGVALFRKEKRGIALTPFGEHLKSRLDGVFSVLDRLPGELEQLKFRTVHTVKLNVLVASIITTDAIAAYKAENPYVNFQVLQSREDADCHISITPGSAVRTPAGSCVITEDIYLAVPKNSEFAGLESVDLRQVQDAWFISTSYARPFRRTSDEFCMQAGFKPKVTFESDFPSAVRNLISAGAGIGFWPGFSFGQIAPDIKLLPISFPQCRRRLTICLHQNAAASAEAAAFYRYLVTFLQEKAQQAVL